ncbi:hypothetical protein WJX75_002658 [Coccomyxa subellipsoidea]|uniref:Uncharacterized protein n=1 Tax=Coccomyxa subellipsoidea TaxID=248742 RepID=A0ABR2YM56_9CHLO
MGSTCSCLLGSKAGVSDDALAEASNHNIVEDLEEASIVLDKPHDSAESGTNSRRSSGSTDSARPDLGIARHQVMHI